MKAENLKLKLQLYENQNKNPLKHGLLNIFHCDNGKANAAIGETYQEYSGAINTNKGEYSGCFKITYYVWKGNKYFLTHTLLLDRIFLFPWFLLLLPFWLL